MYIIYDIITFNDQNAFLLFLNNNIYLCQLPKEKQMLNLDSKEAALYHVYELENNKNIRHYINEDEFPENYENNLGENINYLFRYKSNYISNKFWLLIIIETNFEDFIKFVELEKENINNYLKELYGHENLEKIILKLISYFQKIMNFDSEYFKIM